MNERQDPLDRLLDEALKSYGKAPENEGLEQRILVRVAENARVRHPVRPLTWAISAALLAGMTFLFWSVTPKVRRQPARTTTAAVKGIEPAPLQVMPARAPLPVLKRTGNVRKLQKPSATPKLLRFPAPSPMTSEEHALLQLVIGNTERVPKELIKLGGPITPIQITALEVKPLGSGGQTKE